MFLEIDCCSQTAGVSHPNPSIVLLYIRLPIAFETLCDRYLAEFNLMHECSELC